MKRVILILAALAAWTATATTPGRTATEAYVTNKIAAAVAALPEPDYSTNNAELVETIQTKAPALGNYGTVSNRAMMAVLKNGQIVDVGTTGFVSWGQYGTQYLTKYDGGWAFIIDDYGLLFLPVTQGENVAATMNDIPTWATLSGKPTFSTVATSGAYSDLTGKPTLAAVATSGAYSDLSGKPTNVSAFSNDAGYLTGYTETDPTISAWAKAANKPTYTASEVGATTPADVTAAIREQSLGGIWDEELQVWWTPRMRNGSLTYEATTNVNLNAEN